MRRSARAASRTACLSPPRFRETAMIRNGMRGAACAALLLLGVRAEAQYTYPPGYGAYGWGGWAGGATAPGDIARGLGAFAAGAGAYNLQTAKAIAIEGEAAARLNEYLYQAQQVRNQRYREKVARQQAERVQTAEAIYLRLHNNPEPRDIDNG